MNVIHQLYTIVGVYLYIWLDASVRWKICYSVGDLHSDCFQKEFIRLEWFGNSAKRINLVNCEKKRIKLLTSWSSISIATKLAMMVLFRSCASDSLDITNVCEIDVINIASSTIVSVLLGLGIFYILFYNYHQQRWMRSKKVFFWKILQFLVLIDFFERIFYLKKMVKKYATTWKRKFHIIIEQILRQSKCQSYDVHWISSSSKLTFPVNIYG